MSETHYRVTKTGNFELLQISKKWYRLKYIGRQDNAILMTGSDVPESFHINFTFALKRVHLYHGTSTIGTASTDELQITLRRSGILGIDPFVDDFYKKTDITNSKAIISFEDLGEEGGIVFEASTITLIIKSTSTDLVQALIYVKRLE